MRTENTAENQFYFFNIMLNEELRTLKKDIVKLNLPYLGTNKDLMCYMIFFTAIGIIFRRNSNKNTIKKNSNTQKNNSYLKSLNSRWQLFFTVMTRQK